MPILLQRANRIVSLYVLILALACQWQRAQAATQIEDDASCSNCVGNGGVVCRPIFYDRYAYCCDVTEVGTRACGGADVFCTSDAQNSIMNAFTCPYTSTYCGATTSELEMHPFDRNNLKIEIKNRYFADGETCYYQFYVPDSELDLENMRYFWDMTIDESTNTLVQINNGTSLATADDPIEVGLTTGTRFQFTAEQNQIFVSFLAEVSAFSSEDPHFSLTIKLRSFELVPTPDPVDPEPVEPEPVEPEPVEPEPVEPEPVVPEPVEPVEPEPVEPEPLEPEVVIVVVPTKPTDTTPVRTDLIPDDQEQINDTETETIYVTETEYITVRKPVTVREQSMAKERKKQVGLTVLTGFTVLAILVYISISICTRVMQKKKSNKKITSMSSFNTIEVSQSVGQSQSKTAMGQSEQHGLMIHEPMGTLNDNNFEDDQKKPRKIKITDALQEPEVTPQMPADAFDAADMKKSVTKKGKKKKKVSRKSHKSDNQMLSVQNVEDEDNNSWDSSRGHAIVADLSQQAPAPQMRDSSALGTASVHSRKKKSSQLEAPITQHYLATQTLSQHGSREQLSVHDQLANIEEAVDLSARGSRENLHAGDFHQATMNVGRQMSGSNLSYRGGGENSAMAAAYGAGAPMTSKSNMPQLRQSYNAFETHTGSDQNLRMSGQMSGHGSNRSARRGEL